MSSFVTTYFMGDDDEYTYTIWYPYEVFRGLVRMTLGILVDDRMLDATGMRSRTGMPRVIEPRKPPSLLQRLFTRFLLGLPVVGAGSIAHLLMSIRMPFTWLRFRTRRASRQSRDMMALIFLAVVLAGAARRGSSFQTYLSLVC